MTRRFDAIIVGAGPAGSTVALLLARAGLDVVLVERGEYPGAKNMFGGVFYGHLLNELIPNWWEEAPIERYITRRVTMFLAPEASFAIDFKTANFGQPPYNGCTIFRPHFDRWYAEKAVQAGALLLPETVVDDLIWQDGRVVGVRTRRADGKLYADVVVAADGVNSFLAKKAGLQREFRDEEMAVGVKEVIALDRRTIEERFGLRGDEGVDYEVVGACTGDAHGGGFLYTYKEAVAIGIVVQIASLARAKAKPHELLDAFKRHPSIAPLIRGGRAKEYSAHMVPEAGWAMIPQLYTDGLLVVGDAAALTFATGLFLEGMNYAIGSGIAAAETILEARAQGDFSRRTLAGYRRRLEQSFVLEDHRRFRHAPAFVNSERVQNVYPILLCRAAETLFTVDNSRPKRKLLGIAREQVRRAGVSWLQLLRDLWGAGRAFGW